MNTENRIMLFLIGGGRNGEESDKVDKRDSLHA